MEPLPNLGREPGWPSVDTGYLAILVVKEVHSVQAISASPMAGKLPGAPTLPSCETQ